MYYYSLQNKLGYQKKLRRKKVASFLLEAVEDYMVARCRGSHIFLTIDSQMAVRL
jgi:hypothetical protein